MNNADTPKYAKVTKHTPWQELVPFLRTGDIVTVYRNQGEPERDATVAVDPGSPWVTASSRSLRFADGTFNSNVTDVFLHSAYVRTNELEPLATSLKAGDVVRATFVYAGSPAATLEGTVLTDEDGDALLVAEDEDGDSPEVHYLTFFGRIAGALRALEVVDPDEANITKAPSWVDVLPFLVTGDIVTVHVSGMPPTRDATVTVDPDGTIVTERWFLRYHGGAPGDFIENVILEELADPNSDTLRTTLRSLKAGDVVHASFLEIGDAATALSTLEGRVDFDEDGDAFVKADQDEYGAKSLAIYGVIPHYLRALEVLSRAEDTPEPEDTTPDGLQTQASTAADHPGAGTFRGLRYATASLSGEVGDLSEKVAKMQYEGGYLPDSEHLWGGDRADLTAALHNVAEYLAMTCSEVGVDPEKVLRRSLNKSTLISPDTTDLRAWLDGLPIGATIVDAAISDTETDTGYWEATKVRSDVFIASNGFRWHAVDLVDGVSDYRLLMR